MVIQTTLKIPNRRHSMLDREPKRNEEKKKTENHKQAHSLMRLVDRYSLYLFVNHDRRERVRDRLDCLVSLVRLVRLSELALPMEQSVRTIDPLVSKEEDTYLRWCNNQSSSMNSGKYSRSFHPRGLCASSTPDIEQARPT